METQRVSETTMGYIFSPTKSLRKQQIILTVPENLEMEALALFIMVIHSHSALSLQIQTSLSHVMRT